jgi:hypothetical protein
MQHPMQIALLASSRICLACVYTQVSRLMAGYSIQILSLYIHMEPRRRHDDRAWLNRLRSFRGGIICVHGKFVFL